MVRLFIFIILTCTFNVLVNAEESENDDTPGYYWRDYTGEIPKDALPGGINSNGHTTYIGQVLHKEQIIPAKIDPDDKKVYYEWGYQEHEAYQNIKILCTKHPEQFEWFPTGNRRINAIKDKTFVVGGYEPGNTLLVGRKQLDDELAVGKIVFTNTQSTLNTTKKGVGTQHGDFEVLCYNPNIKIAKRTKAKLTRPIVINFYNNV